MTFITLRPATMKDAGDLFRWKNDPGTRKFAIAKHEKIYLKEHYNWLKKNLKKIMIILDKNTPCGDVRIDKKEISIRISKEYRKQGIATEVLQFFDRKLTAKIVEGNIASMRAFINAGYKPKSYKNGVYIYEKTR